MSSHRFGETSISSDDHCASTQTAKQHSPSLGTEIAFFSLVLAGCVAFPPAADGV